MTVVDHSQDWIKLTTILALFNVGLQSTRPVDSVDYQQCFHNDDTSLQDHDDEIDVPTRNQNLSVFDSKNGVGSQNL